MNDFIYNQERQNYWIEKFHEQEERIKAERYDGEKIVQCLDTKSFDGKYYNPMWVVTSEARIWSLARNHEHGDWNLPYPNKKTNRWYVKNNWDETVKRLNDKSENTIYMHQIVANYFCDRTAINIYGENNCAPHHCFRYHALYKDKIVATKQEDCRWNNRAKHLRYVYVEDHMLLTYIQQNYAKSAKEIVKKLTKGIYRKDRYTGKKHFIKLPSDDINENMQYLSEIVNMGKFYTNIKDRNGKPLRDNNGKIIKRDNWTAIWCNYDVDDSNQETKDITKKFIVESHNLDNNLPYLK